jgi:cytochrome c-type biogenesis protein CcmE
MTTEVIKPVRASRRRIGVLLIGALIIVAAVVYLLVTSVSGSQVYYLTVAELKNGQKSSEGGLRVSGVVDGDSIQWDAQKMLLRFAVSDGAASDGGERLDVVYQGVRPDMLRDGATAVLEGKLGADGVFEARTLLLSCPSKYQAAATATAVR